MKSFDPTGKGPIGVFDSGYGGLTILEHMLEAMPDNDFIYFGDNARTPYGTRSFQVVYEFTLQCVTRLFEMGCPLVILACNTASAKALRTIQQVDLPKMDPTRRVLGIIRPTVEIIDSLTETRHVGLLATPGTIKSLSYPLEIGKLYPDIKVTGESCPIWVPLVENGLAGSEGTDFFVRQHVERLLTKDPLIDSIILGCTHYPLLIDSIRKFVPERVNILCQGQYVAESLQQYLNRHPEMSARCTTGGTCRFVTTESAQTFLQQASVFLDSTDKLDVSTITFR